MTDYNLFVRPKGFYESETSDRPVQMRFEYGDIPVLKIDFFPGVLHAGDTLVFAGDNDMVFYNSAAENILKSDTCMLLNKHLVIQSEVETRHIEIPINTRTVKFRDVVNGRKRPVEINLAMYCRHNTEKEVLYYQLAKGTGFCAGIIADYDAVPEPITTDEYYTKKQLDSLIAGKADLVDGKVPMDQLPDDVAGANKSLSNLDEVGQKKFSDKADKTALDGHVQNQKIHVTEEEKKAWNEKLGADALNGYAKTADLKKKADLGEDGKVLPSQLPEVTPGADTSLSNLSEIGNAKFSALIPKKLTVETLTGTAVVVNPSKCYEWNAEGTCTLNADGWSADGEEWTTMYINVAEGAVIQGGTNLTLTGDITPGKMNYCQLKGFKGVVRLYVLEVY